MSVSEKIYCAFCRIPRRAYLKKHVTFTNAFLSFLTSVMLMFAFWGEVEPKAAIIFVGLLCLSEAYIQVRWRLSIRCPHCGFDPVLYIRDRDQLVEKVKKRLSEVKESPSYLLSADNPLRNLPYKKVEQKWPSLVRKPASGALTAKSEKGLKPVEGSVEKTAPEAAL